MSVRIIHGDCREVLKTLPDESVHCCVTSPPYWGLRDYGTATWEGGDSQCDHIQSQQPQSLAALADKHAPRVNPRNPNRQDDESINARQYRDVCGKCGAQRVDVQIGLEATPDEYVAKMVEVFREVRRVLQKDATCWIVLGDSYSTAASGLPHKNLVGIPWRVALALQADGWYLRQDIIWHKPNPMPESVTDRCTKSHEYVFLLTKAARYYYDAESIAEVCVCTRKPGQRVNTTEHYGPTNGGNAGLTDMLQRYHQGDAPTTRNRRSVWTVTTKVYPEAHFATYPPELITPCVLAGCPAGGTVLDLFAGSGTTGEVAERLGRHSILIEANADYVKLIQKRTEQRGLFFGS